MCQVFDIGFDAPVAAKDEVLGFIASEPRTVWQASVENSGDPEGPHMEPDTSVSENEGVIAGLFDLDAPNEADDWTPGSTDEPPSSASSCKYSGEDSDGGGESERLISPSCFTKLSDGSWTVICLRSLVNGLRCLSDSDSE